MYNYFESDCRKPDEFISRFNCLKYMGLYLVVRLPFSFFLYMTLIYFHTFSNTDLNGRGCEILPYITVLL